MKNILKEAVKITNNSIILAIPLILFVKLIDLYSMYSKYHVDTAPKLLIASITLMCMFCVFASGWLYMVKNAIKLSKKVYVLDKDRAKESLGLFKSLLSGVGKHFMSFLGAVCIYVFVIQIIATQLVWFIGVKLIGSLDAASMEALQEISLGAAANNSSMSMLLDNMTPEMVAFFGKWSLLFVIVTFIITYLLMLWFPEIIYGQPNPLKALGSSVVKLFRNFKSTFGLYVVLWMIGFLLLFLNTFSIILNPFLYLLISIVMFYFFVYVVICVFLYYSKSFVKEENEEE